MAARLAVRSRKVPTGDSWHSNHHPTRGTSTTARSAIQPSARMGEPCHRDDHVVRFSRQREKTPAKQPPRLGETTADQERTEVSLGDATTCSDDIKVSARTANTTTPGEGRCWRSGRWRRRRRRSDHECRAKRVRMSTRAAEFGAAGPEGRGAVGTSHRWSGSWHQEKERFERYQKAVSPGHESAYSASVLPSQGTVRQQHSDEAEPGRDSQPAGRPPGHAQAGVSGQVPASLTCRAHTGAKQLDDIVGWKNDSPRRCVQQRPRAMTGSLSCLRRCPRSVGVLKSVVRGKSRPFWGFLALDPHHHPERMEH